MINEKITVTSLEECPMLMTVDDVCNAFGLSKKRVRVWFNDKTFPVIKDGIRKVEKNNLKRWLDIRYANCLMIMSGGENYGR